MKRRAHLEPVVESDAEGIWVVSSLGGEMRAGHRGPVGEIAIIGMACIFPSAPNLGAYWQNIVSGVDAITDVPPGRWDPEVFFDPASTASDRLYCKRGGYLGDLARFNPLEYGVMPTTVDGGDPAHFLSLRVAHEALADAGYADRPFNRERTEVIFGYANYINPGSFNRAMHTLGIEQTLQVVRSLHPEYTAEDLQTLKEELKASLRPFGPDSVGALLTNFATGYIANRLNLMGPNFTVDAACSSALIATDIAARDLLAERCDLALVGAIHLASHVPFLAGFCQLNALSRQSQIRPFDMNADGTLAGEGVGVVVLKRRDDAELDGDRIYGVIRGIGTSSDGRAQGPFAPRVEGEELAIRRAHEAAGIAPETVELIEAHGTATPVGDLAEIQALTRVFGPRKGPLPTCAVGTIKSMIGHAMPAAGIAGLIKVALALHHKILPPTLHCDTPNPKLELEKTPFYINTETRPWIHGLQDTPRRAGVNAFGFGGVNAHVIVEEHVSNAGDARSGWPLHWETEVCLVQGASRRDLIQQARRLERYLDADNPVHLKDLAYTLNTDLSEGSLRLALVASSLADLRQKLTQARERLEDPACRQIKDVRGLYFFQEPLRRNGKLAFLFPGEAAQYPNMLKDLCLHFPEVRAVFDRADQLFIKEGKPLLPSQSIFPIPGSSDAERLEIRGRLWEMGGALEAIMIANWAVYTLLRHLEIRPDAVLGHSAGEYSALTASGILSEEGLALKCLGALSTTSERLTKEGGVPEAAMAAVGTDRRLLTPLLDQMSGELYVCNDNCPHQVVIAGSEDAVENAIGRLRAEGVICQRLPFNRAYHTPMFAAVSEVQREFLKEVPFSPPGIEIFSSSTMAPYPRDLEEIREVVNGLWSRPVEFTGSIEAMYAAGARLFVEVGPKGNLTAFVDDILRGRPHLAIPCDVPLRSGVTQLNHLIGVLSAHGVSMRLDYLYERRSPRRVRLNEQTTAGNGGAKQPTSLPLTLDLPTMRLSPNGARSLARRSSAPVTRATPMSASQEGQGFAASAPALGSLPTLGGPLEQLAVRPTGLDQAGALGAVPSVAQQAMQEHLQTMERFLAVEQQIMEAFLEGSGGLSAPMMAETPSAATASPFPFIGTITSLTAGQEVVILRRLDPDHDLFLRDHAYTGGLSDVDQTLQPLLTVPFTMCMEIMAEAAGVLMPGKVLIGMREVEVRQWIEVSTTITLEITARRGQSEEEVEVQIRNLGDGANAEVPTATSTVEGTAIFAHAYPQAPVVASLSLRSERPCRHTAKQMYEERLMFHGPRLQGVASLDSIGDNGIQGHLQVLPPTDLFRSTTAPHLLTDPVLLDAASQILGYWALQRLETGRIVFPIRLSALEVYGSTPPVSQRVRCEVEIQQVSPRQLRATLNLCDSDGRLLVRLVDWEDWRFFWPERLFDVLRFPREHLLTEPWETPIFRLPGREAFVCQWLNPTAEHTRANILGTLAHMILSGAERRQWRDLRGPDIRRTEWLFGRAAAKDAVRRLLKSSGERERWPADVEIGHDQDGRPFATVLGPGEPATMPSISIAHTNGVVVAIAGYCAEGQRLGIDIEQIRTRQMAFQEIAFNNDELMLLDSLGGPVRDEWVTRLWCAKEATAKALGKGLVEGPRSVAVRKVDAATGTVEVVLGEGLAGGFPELAGVPLVVYTAREGDWVVASTLCERS